MMKTCAELLIELLEAYNIDTVFGIPGVHTIELYRHLPDSKLQHITPRHEQGAGFMADGYARVTGKPAACFVISGPGVTNILTAMGQAYADSIPMLVISSVNNLYEIGLGEGHLHELPDQNKLVAGASAFSHTLKRVDELPHVLARAFTVFNCARPRPVHIEIPLNILTQTVMNSNSNNIPVFYKPAADSTAIDRVVKLISNADNALVVLGGGTVGAVDSVRKMVDKLALPVITTINAKGVLPPDHPLSLGSSLPIKAVLDTLENADIVLAVGTELGETDTLLFDKKLSLKGHVIRIDIDKSQLNINTPAQTAILSDAGLACQALFERFEVSHQRLFEQSKSRVQQIKASIDSSYTKEQKFHKTIMDAVQQALPNAIIVGDSTQLVYSSNLFYEPEQPRSYFNSCTGFGTLGYALPAAIGAKLAQPNRHVVAIIGDGGLQFVIGELACAVENNIPIIILLWNNKGYAEIKKYMLEQQVVPLGVDIFTPDFQTIGRGFGCDVSRVDDIDELKQQLIKFQSAPGPCLIEIDAESTC